MHPSPWCGLRGSPAPYKLARKGCEIGRLVGKGADLLAFFHVRRGDVNHLQQETCWR
jgi:hypothetical protein